MRRTYTVTNKYGILGGSKHYKVERALKALDKQPGDGWVVIDDLGNEYADYYGEAVKIHDYRDGLNMYELYRADAVKIAGKELVDKVDSMDCDLTGRILEGTAWFGLTEFSATVEDDDCRIRGYYYQDPVDVDNCDGDLGSLDWEVDHYAIEEL